MNLIYLYYKMPFKPNMEVGWFISWALAPQGKHKPLAGLSANTRPTFCPGLCHICEISDLFLTKHILNYIDNWIQLLWEFFFPYWGSLSTKGQGRKSTNLPHLVKFLCKSFNLPHPVRLSFFFFLTKMQIAPPGRSLCLPLFPLWCFF